MYKSLNFAIDLLLEVKETLKIVEFDNSIITFDDLLRAEALPFVSKSI